MKLCLLLTTLVVGSYGTGERNWDHKEALRGNTRRVSLHQDLEGSRPLLRRVRIDIVILQIPSSTFLKEILLRNRFQAPPTQSHKCLATIADCGRGDCGCVRPLVYGLLGSTHSCVNSV